MALVIEVGDTCDGVETRRSSQVSGQAHQHIDESKMDLLHRMSATVSKDSVVATRRNVMCREVTEETHMRIPKAV